MTAISEASPRTGSRGAPGVAVPLTRAEWRVVFPRQTALPTDLRRPAVPLDEDTRDALATISGVDDVPEADPE